MTKIPAGFTEEQWNAVTEDLKEHPETINDYRKVLNRFLKTHPSFLHAEKDEMEAFFAELNSSSLSFNTIHRYQVTLRAVAYRIEKHPELFEGYVNPFKGLIQKDVRHKKQYRKDSFLDSDTIRKLLEVMPQLSAERGILFLLMLDLGLSPAEIIRLKISDFYEEDALFLRIGKNTSFSFSPFFSALLKERTPQIGHIDDERSYFMTSRHNPFTYRSIYQAVQELAVSAHLENADITPYKMSLTGILHTCYLHQSRKMHDALSDKLAEAKTGYEKRKLRKQLRQCETVLEPVSSLLSIGEWVNELPAHHLQKLEEIQNQCSEEDLFSLLGIPSEKRNPADSSP